ncbi:MAG: PASTA domain-containing protein [Spirochaetales bacterium]|nr:PASTA domain-containing protein [Spirochaetales bacterium]
MKYPAPRQKKQPPSWFTGFLAKVLPTKADDPETLLYKKISYVVVGMIFITSLLAFTVFVFSLRGREETMVPKVVGEDLITAIQDLQEKELVPHIQVQFSNSPKEKGTVVGQDPQGGILVKSGRQITLWVSKGAVIDKVPNYIGQNINDVELNLKSLFATQSQVLVTVENDPMYVYDNSPEGTILEQKPTPGTPISSNVTLKFVISRGPKSQLIKVGSYVGQDYLSVMSQLEAQSLPFEFTVRALERNELPGRVVAQDPAPTVGIPRGGVIHLTMTKPTVPAGQVFGLFKTTLPQYPILVDLKLEIKTAAGDVSTLVAMKHPGGAFSVPYLAAPGDTLILSILGKPILTQTVAP